MSTCSQKMSSEDEDLEALRSAVLASMKPSQPSKPAVISFITGDEELSALREAALKSAKAPVVTALDTTASVTPTQVFTSNPAIKFIGDNKPTETVIVPQPVNATSTRNLIVINTKPENAVDTKIDDTSVALVNKLLRPQDKYHSENTSASSTPTQSKGSNKFDRFDSSTDSDSDSDDNSSSSSEADLSRLSTNLIEDIPQISVAVNNADVKPDQSREGEPFGDTISSHGDNIISETKVDTKPISLDNIPIPDTIPDTKVQLSTKITLEETPYTLNTSYSRHSVPSNAGDNCKTTHSNKPTLPINKISGTQNTIAPVLETESDIYSNKNPKNCFQENNPGGILYNSTVKRKDNINRNTSLTEKHKGSKTAAGELTKKGNGSSIFHRLGMRNDSQNIKNIQFHKETPIQKSSLLYDIISKSSPALLEKFKPSNTDGLEKLSEREQLILEARKKKFESNQPLASNTKTVSLKGIFKRKAAKKSKHDKSKKDGAKVLTNRNDIPDRYENEHISSDLLIATDTIKISDKKHLKHKKIKRLKLKSKKHKDVTITKGNIKITCTNKNEKTSPPDKDNEKIKNGNKKLNTKTQDVFNDNKKEQSKIGPLSDSDSSDSKDVSWRFHHTGKSAKYSHSSENQIHVLGKHDIEGHKRRRSVCDSHSDLRHRQSFRLSDRTNQTVPEQRDRSWGHKSDKRDYKLTSPLLTSHKYSRNDSESASSLSTSGVTYKGKLFVPQDEVDAEKDNTDRKYFGPSIKITSIVQPSKARKSSTHDDIGTSCQQNELHPKKTRRTVLIPKSHDGMLDSNTKHMTLSLKRKNRKHSPDEDSLASSRKSKVNKSVVSRLSITKRPLSKVNKDRKTKDTKKITPKRKSDEEAKLDERISQIQENNAAILKRRREVMEDRQRFA